MVRRQVLSTQSRLHAYYAVVAGLLILPGLPLFENLLLGPTGYFVAADRAATNGDFAPLLIWIAAHTTLNAVFHIVELLPFMFLVPFPRTVRQQLDGARPRSSLIFATAGQVGVILYAVALAIGIPAATTLAEGYARTLGTPRETQYLASFGNLLAIQNLVAQVAGALFLVIWLVAVSIRGARLARIPRALTLFGLGEAALLAVSAVQYLAQPMVSQTALSGLSLLLFAVWVVLFGLQVTRLPVPGGETGTSIAGASRDSDADDRQSTAR